MGEVQLERENFVLKVGVPKADPPYMFECGVEVPIVGKFHLKKANHVDIFSIKIICFSQFCREIYEAMCLPRPSSRGNEIHPGQRKIQIPIDWCAEGWSSYNAILWVQK